MHELHKDAILTKFCRDTADKCARKGVGLMANWRKEVERRQEKSQSISLASKRVSTSSGADELDGAVVEGVFDHDEDKALISAARKAKSSVKIVCVPTASVSRPDAHNFLA